MKKIILLFALLISTISFAQSNSFNYKALLVDNGTPVANAIISVKVKLKNGTSTITRWYEQHNNIHTDANGIFTINIGTGTRISGATSFDEIDWKLYSDMKLTVEVDNGSGFSTLIDNVPFGSVPYAKNADVTNKFYGQTNKEIKLTTTTGNLYHGLRFAKGNDDWYLFIDPSSTFIINNDGANVFKISDADNSIWINGELHKTGTGDADLIPIAYGLIGNNGTIINGTGNFTVSHTSDGDYDITLTNHTDLKNDNTVIIATPGSGADASFIRAFTQIAAHNYVTVKTMNSSGSASNKTFYFIIYKK